MASSVVSVILARGGSKEIPRKNIIDINGRLLLSYSIQASQESRSGETWVSTDDREIEQVAICLGAKVLKRPAAISQDNSKSEDALLHFAENVAFDFLVFIQNTSPLIRADDIDKGLLMVESGQYDSVFSVTKEHWIPRWNMDVTPDEWNPDSRPRRQDMPAKYVENGAFYITSRGGLLKSRCRYSGRIGVVEMPLSRSFQLDSADDLQLLSRLLP